MSENNSTDEKTRRLKAQLDKISRKNRRFTDALIRLIWCEIRLPIGHSTRSCGDEWADCMLPWWSQWEDDVWTTAREKLSKTQINTLTLWMQSHTADYDFCKGWDIMHELFNDCQLCALNSCPSALRNRPTAPTGQNNNDSNNPAIAPTR